MATMYYDYIINRNDPDCKLTCIPYELICMRGDDAVHARLRNCKTGRTESRNLSGLDKFINRARPNGDIHIWMSEKNDYKVLDLLSDSYMCKHIEAKERAERAIRESEKYAAFSRRINYAKLHCSCMNSRKNASL